VLPSGEHLLLVKLFSILNNAVDIVQGQLIGINCILLYIVWCTEYAAMRRPFIQLHYISSEDLDLETI